MPVPAFDCVSDSFISFIVCYVSKSFEYDAVYAVYVNK